MGPCADDRRLGGVLRPLALTKLREGVRGEADLGEVMNVVA